MVAHASINVWFEVWLSMVQDRILGNLGQHSPVFKGTCKLSLSFGAKAVLTPTNNSVTALMERYIPLTQKTAVVIHHLLCGKVCRLSHLNFLSINLSAFLSFTW